MRRRRRPLRPSPVGIRHDMPEQVDQPINVRVVRALAQIGQGSR